MIRRARLRFWLAMMNVARALHSRTRSPFLWSLYLWVVGRASAAEDWGPPLERDGEDGPW